MFPNRSLTTAAACLLWAGTALAQDDPRAKATPKDQRVEGVVVKVEPVGGPDRSKNERQRIRLTINTAAVWRDYVRDTATQRGASPEKAAKKGEESVATKGQPEGRNNLVTVETTPESRLELRYRGAMDERSLGAASADEARRLSARDVAKSAPSDEPATAGKTATTEQIKPGLFVHVRYHRAENGDQADRVLILEPVLDDQGK